MARVNRSAAVVLLCSLFAALAAAFAVAEPTPVALDDAAGVIELKGMLQEYQPSGVKPDDATWYMFTASNASDRPATRVLVAGQQPGGALGLMPPSRRPAVLKVQCLDAEVGIERTRDYGHDTFRITLPPGAATTVAVQVENAGVPPSLLAWTEPSLSAHNRWMAIFFAAVAGLIAAAAAIAGGLAAMAHARAPRWAALTLLAMLMSRLAAVGLFDRSIVTPVGGPYGLVALFDGLTLAAGLRLIDIVEPFDQIWPQLARHKKWLLLGVVALAFFAYLGLPVAVLLVDLCGFVAAPAVAAYVIWRSRDGSAAAHSLTASAILFALQVLTAGAAAVGLLGETSFMPDLAGCFAAAGAVLLTLAMAAGEGVGVFGHARHAALAAPVSPPAPAPAPVSAPALEAIGAALQGVFEYDIVMGTVQFSREAAQMVGLGDRACEMSHDAWVARILADDRPVYAQALKDLAAESGFAFRIEFRLRGEKGRVLWFELRATMKGPAGAPAQRCIGLLADVTTRKQSEAAESGERIVRDSLTGMGNRVALMETLDGLGDGLPETTYALIDIDRFKAIHASLGDEGGDRVLALVAERLAGRYCNAAALFRVGGDSFAVLARARDAHRFGEELVGLCADPYRIDGRSVFAPVSVGVAAGGDAGDAMGLIGNAELALRQAKRDGGGCARAYAAGMETQAPADSVALEADLHHALDAGEMVLFYQPIMRLKDRSVAGFEALLRWRHPTKGLLGSEAFVRHAEESGLILDLGRYALMHALEDLAGWQRYFPLSEPLFVSVNLSRRQLADGGFEGVLTDVLRGANIAPGSLVLEVTESAVADPNGLGERLSRIRAMGVTLSIDDFGTGLSSLSALRDLPFDTVKIDKSFLARRQRPDAEDGVILSSMVTMARDLGRHVVVEGVESEEDAARLTELGCDMAQGFLFAEPLSIQETLKFIARHFRVHRKE